VGAARSPLFVAALQSGNAQVSQFFGNSTMQAPALSGAGTCSGQAGHAERRNAPTTLRWEAPTMRLVPTGNSTGSTVCFGDVVTVVWILGR
jgi:hypothetical protein